MLKTLQLLSSKVKSTPQGFRRGLLKGRWRICTVVSNIQKQVKTQHLRLQQRAITVLNTIVHCSVYVCTQREIACIIFSGIKTIQFLRQIPFMTCTLYSIVHVLYTIIESGEVGCHIDKRWGHKGHMMKSIDFSSNWRTIFTNSAHPFFVHFNNSGLVKGWYLKIDTNSKLM